MLLSSLVSTACILTLWAVLVVGMSVVLGI
jgi:hypothetical protein